MVKVFRTFFLLILTSVIINAQSIIATATTDSSDYLVGDYIKFTIKVEHDESIRVSPPTLTDKLGSLEVVKVLPVTLDEENKFQQFNYIISGYDSARIVIPPIPITYFVENNSEPQTTETNEVVVFIHTLEVVPNSDIKDVKQPVRISIDWVFWLLLIFIVAILIIVAYLLYRKYKKPEEEIRIIKRTPPTPIHIMALKALDKLKDKKLWQQGKVKEYHSELTGIIRKYFEDRYHFNSLEMTTSENLNVLNRIMDNQKLIDTTEKFLQNADMVKFAKFEPMPSINEEMLKQAYDIVEKTKPDEVNEMGA